MKHEDDDQEDDHELGDQRLCAQCVGDSYLKAEIEREGEEHKCDYCGEVGATLSIEDVAGYVAGAFERQYFITSSEPTPLEYAMMSEGGYQWERKGERATDAIAMAAEIDEEPAESIRLFLAEEHWDMDSAQIGEEMLFGEDTYHAEIDPDDIELRENWGFFEKSLKTEARFFSATAEATLQTVFEGLHDHRKHDGDPVVIEAGPGTALTGIYRARVFQSTEKLEDALRDPVKDLGPPPPALAFAGRMNARGVSVLYGATDAETAVGEVRPPVGSRVAVARFEFLRNVRLLDVNALQSVYVEGSIFDPEFKGRLELAKFLEGLSDRFAMPVMPDDEPLDYLPTQAIADYLATKIDPPLDGILYPSVQHGGSAVNIVLFHKSSRVAPISLPEGTDITVSTGMHSEEGWEEHYWIWESVPPTDTDATTDKDDSSKFADIFMSALPYDQDLREPTLGLDLSSLQIHHVYAAKYATNVHTVERHRREKSTTSRDPDF